MNEAQKKLINNLSKAAEELAKEMPKMIKGLEKNMNPESAQLIGKAMETTNLTGIMNDLNIQQKDYTKEYENFMKQNGGNTK